LTLRADRHTARRGSGTRLKSLPGALLVVAVILFGAAYFLPSTVRVSHSIVIARPAPNVLALIQAPRRAEWLPWAPAAGSDATAGAAGEAAADGLVTAELHVAGFAPLASSWRLSTGRGVTLVEWSVEVTTGADPVSRYRGLFLAQRLDRDVALGLERLRLRAEQEPATP
jgi:hypothetical protein